VTAVRFILVCVCLGLAAYDLAIGAPWWALGNVVTAAFVLRTRRF